MAGIKIPSCLGITYFILAAFSPKANKKENPPAGGLSQYFGYQLMIGNGVTLVFS